MATLTPSENLVRNIQELMKLRVLSHQAVASAMDILGFSWYRKTVHRVMTGERPIRVDELYGLALVLETTVGVLLSPDIATITERPVFPGIEYRIGTMPLLRPKRFSQMLHVPENKTERAAVGVDGWADRYLVDGLPRWKQWPASTIMDRFSDALAASGWRDVDEFLSAHPEVEDMMWKQLPEFIASHPNPRRESPMA